MLSQSFLHFLSLLPFNIIKLSILSVLTRFCKRKVCFTFVRRLTTKLHSISNTCFLIGSQYTICIKELMSSWVMLVLVLVPSQDIIVLLFYHDSSPQICHTIAHSAVYLWVNHPCFASKICTRCPRLLWRKCCQWSCFSSFLCMFSYSQP